MIDKIGKINPNYETRATKMAQSKQNVAPATGDYASISSEAVKAAELERIKNAVKSAPDPEREEKLRQVREKLANNEYDQLNNKQLDSIANSLMKTFFG